MLLRRLSDLSRRIRLEGAPDEALTTAKLAILDTLGVTLAGSQAECVGIVRRALCGTLPNSGSTLFGAARSAAPPDAAMINGTAAHALDFDDCSNTMGGHPSAPLLPALWALAEREGASGRDVLLAYVVGFEIETKLARAVNFHHYEKGWHPTSTLGTFGAAGACARLLGLDTERFAQALAIAASIASGLKANFGTMTKPFHVGQCARNGLAAALLASEGLTANPAALEHPQGFLAVYNGPGTFDVERLFDRWAEPLDLVEPGVAFKRHPCCASTHPAVDALLRLREEHRFTVDDIVSIRSWTHPRRLRHTNRPDPRSGLEGKFSVQYVLARAALEGSVRLDHFTDEAIHDPKVRALMARIEAAPHPDAIMDTDEHFFADVRVTTRAGATFQAYVDRPLGRDRAHPLPPGALETKFHDCARLVLDAAASEAMADALLRLEEIPDVRVIGERMRAGLIQNVPRLAVVS